MCGIVGFTGKIDNIDDREEVLEKMMARIRHRGPDGQNTFLDGHIALGHVRLSIIDQEGGVQPMQSADGALTVIYNGEIYNYEALMTELGEMGHHFRTKSDTEVLLHGYETWGESVVTHLRGMFAFAIWDREKERLFCARDPFGIKPFYYTLMGGELLFASEIKAFLPHPDFKKVLNEERLPDYLTFGCVPGAETMFQDVYCLMPGHAIVYHHHTLRLTRYFQPSFQTSVPVAKSNNGKLHDSKLSAGQKVSLEKYAEEVAKTVDESIEMHLKSDVEVGCFLSSGVDSSYVASEMAGHQPTKTYTVGFADAKFDEASEARKMADSIHTEHHEVQISAADYFESLPCTAYYLDEPLGNPSANNLWHLAKLAGENLKVVLSGEGADEMFGGYCVYQEPLAVRGYQKLPKKLRRFLGRMAEKWPDFKGRNFLIRGSMTVEERYIGNSNVFKMGERDLYLTHQYRERTPQYYTKPYYEVAKDYDDITKMQYLDINGWMVQQILLKADKMSMAHSLELRVPFLDRDVYQLARTLPINYRVNKHNTKLALRAAAREKINKETANRRKKAFPLPLGNWVKEEPYYAMIRDAFTSNAAKQYFDTDRLVQLLDDHRQGKRLCLSKIWVVYSFLVWYQVYFEKIQ